MNDKWWYINPIEVEISARLEKLISVQRLRAAVDKLFLQRVSKYFKLYRPVSITTTQFCHCSMKAAIANS